jgi:hypothetical protein
MSTSTILSPGEVDSVVLGAADNEVERLGIKMSSPARDFLLRRALPVLNELNRNGELESARREIENNTATLINFVFEEELNQRRGSEITVQDLRSVFDKICQKFPDLRPFCTKPD